MEGSLNFLDGLRVKPTSAMVLSAAQSPVKQRFRFPGLEEAFLISQLPHRWAAIILTPVFTALTLLAALDGPHWNLLPFPIIGVITSVWAAASLIPDNSLVIHWTYVGAHWMGVVWRGMNYQDVLEREKKEKLRREAQRRDFMERREKGADASLFMWAKPRSLDSSGNATAHNDGSDRGEQLKTHAGTTDSAAAKGDEADRAKAEVWREMPPEVTPMLRAYNVELIGCVVIPVFSIAFVTIPYLTADPFQDSACGGGRCLTLMAGFASPVSLLLQPRLQLTLWQIGLQVLASVIVGVSVSAYRETAGLFAMQQILHVVILVVMALCKSATEKTLRRRFCDLAAAKLARQEVARQESLIAGLLEGAVPPWAFTRLRASTTLAEATSEDVMPHAAVGVIGLADFGHWSTALLPARVVLLLHDLFSAIDARATRCGVTKISATGDLYVVIATAQDLRARTVAALQGSTDGSTGVSQANTAGHSTDLDVSDIRLLSNSENPLRTSEGPGLDSVDTDGPVLLSAGPGSSSNRRPGDRTVESDGVVDENLPLTATTYFIAWAVEEGASVVAAARLSTLNTSGAAAAPGVDSPCAKNHTSDVGPSLIDLEVGPGPEDALPCPREMTVAEAFTAPCSHPSATANAAAAENAGHENQRCNDQENRGRGNGSDEGAPAVDEQLVFDSNVLAIRGAVAAGPLVGALRGTQHAVRYVVAGKALDLAMRRLRSTAPMTVATGGCDEEDDVSSSPLPTNESSSQNNSPQHPAEFQETSGDGEALPLPPEPQQNSDARRNKTVGIMDRPLGSVSDDDREDATNTRAPPLQTGDESLLSKLVTANNAMVMAHARQVVNQPDDFGPDRVDAGRHSLSRWSLRLQDSEAEADAHHFEIQNNKGDSSRVSVAFCILSAALCVTSIIQRSLPADNVAANSSVSVLGISLLAAASAVFAGRGVASFAGVFPSVPDILHERDSVPSAGSFVDHATALSALGLLTAGVVIDDGLVSHAALYLPLLTAAAPSLFSPLPHWGLHAVLCSLGPLIPIVIVKYVVRSNSDDFPQSVAGPAFEIAAGLAACFVAVREAYAARWLARRHFVSTRNAASLRRIATLHDSATREVAGSVVPPHAMKAAVAFAERALEALTPPEPPVPFIQTCIAIDGLDPGYDRLQAEADEKRLMTLPGIVLGRRALTHDASPSLETADPWVLVQWSNLLVVAGRTLSLPNSKSTPKAFRATADRWAALAGVIERAAAQPGAFGLALVETFGDNFIAAGPFCDVEPSGDGRPAVHTVPFPVSCEAAVQCVATMRALCAEPSMAVHAAMTVGTAHSALVGSGSLLSYRVFGPAVREAAALLDALPLQLTTPHPQPAAPITPASAVPVINSGVNVHRTAPEQRFAEPLQSAKPSNRFVNIPNGYRAASVDRKSSVLVATPAFRRAHRCGAGVLPTEPSTSHTVHTVPILRTVGGQTIMATALQVSHSTIAVHGARLPVASDVPPNGDGTFNAPQRWRTRGAGVVMVSTVKI